jgi:hypothetical protein
LINDTIILIEPDGKRIPVTTRDEYHANRDIIVDGLRQSIVRMYNDIRDHFVLPEKTEFNFKPFKNTNVSIKVETDLQPALLFSGNEIQVNQNLYKKYLRFREIMAQTAAVATKFKDYENYYGFLQIPEYYTLFLLAIADNELTEKIIAAEIETKDAYPKTSLTPEQQEERRDAIKLLMDLRAESMKTANLPRNFRAEDYPTIRKKGITGEILPCWGGLNNGQQSPEGSFGCDR